MIIGISGKIGSGKDTIGKIINLLSDNSISALEEIRAIISEEVEYINPDQKWEVKKMAGKLKQIVSLLTGATLEQLEDQEFKKGFLPEEWRRYYIILKHTQKRITKYFSTNNEAYIHKSELSKHVREEDLHILNILPTYRELLQELGTEILRDMIHPDVHINALFADYNEKFHGNILKAYDLGEKDKWSYPNWIITDVRFENEANRIIEKGGILIRTNRKSYSVDGDELILTNEHPSETGLDKYNKFKYTIDNNGTIEELIEKIKVILLNQHIINAK